MTRRPSRRLTRGALLVAGTAAGLFAMVTPAVASTAGLYCGAGRGATAESAVHAAIEDAENSASGDGLFSCELVGEPEIFEVNDDPYRGDYFRASVNMACE